VIVRDEGAEDAAAIAGVIASAFAGARHSDGSEVRIVEKLRKAGGLSVSLVAEDSGVIVGHVAFSAVDIGEAQGWFGLGPVAVEPARQGGGIGAALIEKGLARLRAQGAAGCVVLGDPGYYARFGFRAHAGLIYAAAPAPYFQALAFAGEPPTGEVRYHRAFG
jgi:predicted N-acetyltransferase YhbS